MFTRKLIGIAVAGALLAPGPAFAPLLSQEEDKPRVLGSIGRLPERPPAPGFWEKTWSSVLRTLKLDGCSHPDQFGPLDTPRDPNFDPFAHIAGYELYAGQFASARTLKEIEARKKTIDCRYGPPHLALESYEEWRARQPKTLEQQDYEDAGHKFFRGVAETNMFTWARDRNAVESETAAEFYEALQNLDGVEIEHSGIISFHAVALDGDTILIRDLISSELPETAPVAIEAGKTRVRIWGIDAPEMRQREGWFARAKLDDLIKDGGQKVSCRIVDFHKKRLVGLCYATQGILHPELGKVYPDFGVSLLSSGNAAAYRTFTYGEGIDSRYSEIYDLAERVAREQRRGLWSHMPD